MTRFWVSFRIFRQHNRARLSRMSQSWTQCSLNSKCEIVRKFRPNARSACVLKLMALRYNIRLLHLSLAFCSRPYNGALFSRRTITSLQSPLCETYRESTGAGIYPLPDKEKKETRRPCKMPFSSSSKRRRDAPLSPSNYATWRHSYHPDDFLHLDLLCADRSII